MEKARKIRLLRVAALVVGLVGGAFAVFTGTWRSGVLGLSISAALVLFGVGEFVRNEDRAVALTVVGSFGVASLRGVGKGEAAMRSPPPTSLEFIESLPGGRKCLGRAGRERSHSPLPISPHPGAKRLAAWGRG